ncbi:MAG: threonine-phosphate decarboxylase CobD [Pseudomonadota bacterium]
MSGDLEHGGALDRVAMHFPAAPQPWVDLSTGINPWSWPTAPIEGEALRHLPTRADRDRCQSAMAKAFGAPEAAMTLVPGTELAIRLLPQLLTARRVAVLSPTYGDHVESWGAAGAEVVRTDDPLALAGDAEVIVLCNPNNPDGRRFEVDALTALAARQAERGRWLVVDEAYADLDPALSLAPRAGSPGLVILRSTGKFYGLAGLRLGAVLGPPALLEALDRLLGVWRVSGPALIIGAQAYADSAWQHAMRTRLAAARERLDAVIEAAGCRVAGGTDLFRFVETSEAHATWHRLCEHGIYTRRFPWTPSHLRVGLPATPGAEARLANALSLEQKG